MKTIIKSILFTAVLAMVLIGCQKETDDISVSLKSAGVMTVVANWQSGDAAFECGQAGSDCGYAFKIDEWNEEFGMDGDYMTLEGNSIKILNSDGKTFDWVSEYPVCKVIVKAGRGAYIYSYPGGAYHDEGLIGFQGKGISHVTFCYSEPPELIIAVKSYYWNGSAYKYCISSGTNVFLGTAAWCGEWPLGVNNYPGISPIKMVAPGTSTQIGEVIVDMNGDVKVTLLTKELTLVYTWLFIGTEEELKSENLSPNGCPTYSNRLIWKFDDTPEIDVVTEYSFMFFDL